jgi:hypothetical protein
MGYYSPRIPSAWRAGRICMRMPGMTQSGLATRLGCAKILMTPTAISLMPCWREPRHGPRRSGTSYTVLSHGYMLRSIQWQGLSVRFTHATLEPARRSLKGPLLRWALRRWWILGMAPHHPSISRLDVLRSGLRWRVSLG